MCYVFCEHIKELRYSFPRLKFKRNVNFYPARIFFSFSLKHARTHALHVPESDPGRVWSVESPSRLLPVSAGGRGTAWVWCRFPDSWLTAYLRLLLLTTHDTHTQTTSYGIQWFGKRYGHIRETCAISNTLN